MSKSIENDDEIPRSDGTAVSLFGQGAADNDFPVLKAFQQYIDAEQAKARKRMLGLSVFFIMLLVAVVVTFTVVMMSVINRNQALSDRLLDIALRERPAQAAPVVVQQPAPQPIVSAQSRESEMKPFLDKIESLVSAIAAKQQQPLAPAPVVVTTAAPVPSVQPSAENPEAARMREELKKQKEELEAERARLKDAQEKLKQAEIEKHRRRLYPEYYAAQDERAQLPAPLPAQPKPQPKPKAVQAEPTARAASSLEDLKPISYFDRQQDEQPPAKPKANPAPAQKPAAKPAQPPKPAEKPVQAQKPVAKPTPPPSQKQPPPPPPQKPEKKLEAPKTETLDVGTPSGNSTPWLIEQQNL